MDSFSSGSDAGDGWGGALEWVSVGVHGKEFGIVGVHHSNNQKVNLVGDDAERVVSPGKPRGNVNSRVEYVGNAVVCREVRSSVAGGLGDCGTAFSDVFAGGVSLYLGGGKGGG